MTSDGAQSLDRKATFEHSLPISKDRVTAEDLGINQPVIGHHVTSTVEVYTVFTLTAILKPYLVGDN